MKILLMNIVSVILAGSAFGLTSGTWECERFDGFKVDVKIDMEKLVFRGSSIANAGASGGEIEKIEVESEIELLGPEDSSLGSNRKLVVENRKKLGIERVLLRKGAETTNFLMAIIGGTLFIGLEKSVGASEMDVLHFRPGYSCTPK